MIKRTPCALLAPEGTAELRDEARDVRIKKAGNAGLLFEWFTHRHPGTRGHRKPVNATKFRRTSSSVAETQFNTI